jgi:hypothetical protein
MNVTRLADVQVFIQHRRVTLASRVALRRDIQAVRGFAPWSSVVDFRKTVLIWTLDSALVR